LAGISPFVECSMQFGPYNLSDGTSLTEGIYNEEIDFRFYPNPFSSSLFFENGTNETIEEIVLIDALGQKISFSNIESNQLEL